MNPTLPTVGDVWFTQAWTQSMAFLSMHMGSGPGVAGLSGMQVNPLVPLRSVRILPSASIATMVAFLPTFAGAALMALFIRSASLGAGFFCCAFAMRHRANAAQAATPAITFFFINFLPRKEPISVIRAQSGSLRSLGHAATQHRFRWLYPIGLSRHKRSIVRRSNSERKYFFKASKKT